MASIAYAFIDTDQFIRRSTLPEPMDLLFGIVAILLLLEISRRIVDNTFTLVVVGFLVYMYFGNYFPDVISHKGYDLDRIVGHMYMTLEGIFGVPLSVSASFVMLFVVYGTFMDVAGAGGFWLDLSLATMGRKSASAGRGAVITSALLGGPQGSGVATTMSVTPIMWPILQKAGYSPNMAAGLIATGGIGAVLSPPLMGAAAFLIMQFLGVSFWEVVVMVTVPDAPLLRRHAVHGGTGGPQVPLCPSGDRSQDRPAGDAHQGIPPDIDRRSGGAPRPLEQVARIRGARRHRDDDSDELPEPGPE